MKELLVIGIILLVVGIIFILSSFFSGSRGEVKFAFGGFIGPIPFGFANSPEMLKLVIIISIVILFIFLLWLKFL